ncbi:hypothetical protein AN2V17_13370 [Vallitalea sp. AN17-2]|uniref:Uncharacterized protein n=1 Tax=Vallitalea maricola TaxID=3074433 RepID=A0ACB5UI21_9FIRM|nr:hypothetical protein AN2V17_13370 [Vallitalea sp. AN17-2]
MYMLLYNLRLKFQFRVINQIDVLKFKLHWIRIIISMIQEEKKYEDNKFENKSYKKSTRLQSR